MMMWPVLTRRFQIDVKGTTWRDADDFDDGRRCTQQQRVAKCHVDRIASGVGRIGLMHGSAPAPSDSKCQTCTKHFKIKDDEAIRVRITTNATAYIDLNWPGPAMLDAVSFYTAWCAVGKSTASAIMTD